ncbi:hypothetical protein [Streptomyces carminius]|nr:hypothetical protein [Streptomyces carminius]
MMSHVRRRGRLESVTWTAVLVAASAVAMILLLQAARRGTTG